MKKISALLLMAAVVLSLLILSGPGTAYAANSDFVIEEILRDKVLVAYNGEGGDVVIPSGITKIGTKVFLNNTSVTSVVIPNTVTQIWSSAFKGCSNLQSVTIPNSVTNIAEGAFDGCGLTSVTIPDSVRTFLPKCQFAGCYNLKQMSITAKLAGKNFSSNLGNGTIDIIEEIILRSYDDDTTVLSGTLSATDSDYGSYNGLKRVVILDGITTIESKAFQNLTSSITVVIPKSVTSIAADAFDGCTNVTISAYPGAYAETYAKAHSEIAFKVMEFEVSEDGTLTRYLGSGGNVVIPESFDGRKIKSIGVGVFRENTKITGVTISAGVTEICTMAFLNCNALRSVSIPDTVLTIGDYAFQGTAITEISIPESVTSIGDSAFCGAPITEIAIPEGVKTIGDYAFSDNGNLKSASLPGSLTKIGSRILAGCSKLESVYLANNTPEAVKTKLSQELGSDRLYSHDHSWSDWSGGQRSCTVCGMVTRSQFEVNLAGKLTKYTGNDENVVIPESVNGIKVISIGNGAFTNNTTMKSLVIPGTVDVVQSTAFEGCSGLTTVTVPTTLLDNEYFYSYIYSICSNLTKVTIQSGWNNTEIGKAAFSGCTRLTDVTIEKGVTRIKERAFTSCSRLTSVTIPDGVTRIDDDAFRACSSLTSVTIPYSVTDIGEYAFYGCSGLKSVTIPDSVTYLGVGAFERCTGLSSVSIPGSIESIYVGTFNQCSGLKSVTIADGVKRISSQAFTDCKNLTSLSIPDSVAFIGSSAFAYCAELSGDLVLGGVTKITKKAFSGCEKLTSVTLPACLTSFGAEVFEGCTGLRAVVIACNAPEDVISAIREQVGDKLSVTHAWSLTGNGQYICSICNLTDDHTVHRWDPWNTGYRHTCQLCGKTEECTHSSWVNIDSNTRKCSDCGKTEVHSWSAWSNGQRSCTDCGETVTCTHSWSDWDDGQRSCTTCGEAETCAHSWGKNDSDTHKCSNCGKTAEHSWSDWNDDSRSCADCGETETCTHNSWVKNDKNTHKCGKCGKTAEHSWSKWSDGQHSCETCGTTVTCKHSWINIDSNAHKCSICGKTEAHSWSDWSLGQRSCTGCARMEDSLSDFNISADDIACDGQTHTASNVIVKNGETVLTKDTDYTISSDQGVMPGAYSFTITGIGKYSGTQKGTWYITGKLQDATVTVADSSVTGTVLTPKVTVEYYGKTLEEGVDYAISYGAVTTPGVYNVNVNPAENSRYTGKAIGQWKVTGTITDAMVTLNQTQISWDNAEHTPTVSVRYDENTKLTAGTDYTVSVHSQIEVGDYTLTVNGIGAYSGSVEREWYIRKHLDPRFIVDVGDVAYTGDPMTPPVIVYGWGNEQLVQDTDYELEYSDNTDIGTASVKITGIGDYYGELDATFQIMDGNAVTLIMDGESVNKASFAEAWSAANGHTATIALLADQETDGNFFLDDGSDITLRPNGFTLSSTGYQALFVLGSRDEGYSATLNVTGRGTLATYPGEYDMCGGEAFVVMPGGNLVIDNVTVDAGTAISVYGEGANVTVNSGTIKGSYGYAVNVNEGSLTVTGGTFISSEEAIYATSSTVTISGGQFETENAYSKVLKFYEGDILISGGSFTHKVVGDENWETYALWAEYPQSIVVSGGTFTADYPVCYTDDLNSMLPEEYHFLNAENGTIINLYDGQYCLDGVTSVRVGTFKDISVLCSAQLDRDSFTYDGTQQVPDVTVRLKEDNQLLTEGKHYKLDVTGGTEIGNAELRVIGIGDYSGTISVPYSIAPIMLTSADISMGDAQTYDGNKHSPEVSVSHEGTALTKNTDYTVSYTEETNAGDYTVTVKGIGIYGGEVECAWHILRKTVTVNEVVKPDFTNAYTGEPQLPSLSGDPKLTTGEVIKDYSFDAVSQTDVGLYEAVLVFAGNYAGRIPVQWTIACLPIEECEIRVDTTAVYPSLPEVTVSCGNKTMIKDTDYTVCVKDTVKAGENQVYIAGKGNFSGETGVKYTSICPISNAAITVKAVPYDGKENTADVKLSIEGPNESKIWLEKDTEYTLSGDVTAAQPGTYTVTATGKGNYTGSVDISWSVYIPLENAEISCAPLTYTGEAQTPSFTVKLKNGETELTLVSGTDYTVTCEPQTNAGSYLATIEGKGSCSGTRVADWTIDPLNLTNAEYTVSAQDAAYNGREHTTELELSVKMPDGTTRTLDAKEDYTLSGDVTATEPGVYSIAANSMGNFTGTIHTNWKVYLSLSEAKISYDPLIYTGKAQTPSFTVTLMKDDTELTLEPGTDYTVDCESQTETGSYYAVIEGNGFYRGTREVKWSIGTNDIHNGTLRIMVIQDSGDSYAETLMLTLNGTTLDYAKGDYSVVRSCVSDGQIMMIVGGYGKYDGTITRYYPDFKNLTSCLKLPSGTLDIEAEAFRGTAAQVIDIPAGVRSIGTNAFADCEALRLIRFHSDDTYLLSELPEVDKSKVYLQFPSLSEMAKNAIDDGWTVYLSAAE